MPLTPQRIPNRATAAQRPINSLDDERFGNVFDAAFKGTMRKANIQVSESETTIERLGERKVRATVRIYGYAGDVTSNQFFNPKTKALIKGAEAIQLRADGYTEARFRFAGMSNLSGNEFAVTYEQE